ncbi:CAP-Gly domain-containing linker protein 3 [Dermatophagoides farinae]|uniref:CAP-Gly domain-containing linker protein 3 n=1 Tax=Dermatophagoides farinae TaxID=6954 RepID=UPI003F63A75B
MNSSADKNGDSIPTSNSLTNIKSSSSASIHAVDDAPYCENCLQLEFFNINCTKCFASVHHETTSISQLLAIARQWHPDIQTNMDLLIQRMLDKGAHPDDRDQLTDMTLLHFACKSGAIGIGDAEKSLNLVVTMVEKHQANPNLICKWNDMSALHIATYFDVAPIVGYLVTVVKPSIIDYPSRYLDSQTPLHIAATNLCLRSARILLSSGANILLKDDRMKTPLDCVPIEMNENSSIEMNQPDISLELRTILEEATLIISGESNSTDAECMKTAKVVLSALGLEIGDRIIVGNAKVGTLRYCGPTQFATGIWTGIQLDEPIGKNDGSIDGVRYFVCPPNYGIFAPINRISKLDTDDCDLMMMMMMNHSFDSKQHHHGRQSNHYHYGYNPMNVHSKIDTGLNTISRYSHVNLALSSSRSSINSEDVCIGSKVYLTDKKTGIIRFMGPTKFAPGIWYGVELTRPIGKNDGSVQGVRYFTCKQRYGIFVSFARIAKVMSSSNSKNSPAQIRSSQDVSESEDDSDMSLNYSGTSSLDLLQFTQLKNTESKLNNSNHHNNNNNDDHNVKNHNKPAIRRSMSLCRNISTTTTTKRHSDKGEYISNSNSLPHEKSWLRIGVNVLVNGMVGSIRYIGPVHFAAKGIFLGIELRTPSGKNDGSIDGKRYFTCKPNHGLFARPKKVTIRGINAAKLLPDSQN